MSQDIPVAAIDPDPDQARKRFENIPELAESMRANGLAVPVSVRRAGDRYVLIHGERRWRAAKHLKWKTIRAEIRDDVNPDQARWLSLIENIQREDLSPIEEAEAYQSAIDRDHLKQAALGSRIGKTQSYIAHKLQLLKLPSSIRLYIHHRAISEAHVNQLLRIKPWFESVTRDFSNWREVARQASTLSDGEWFLIAEVIHQRLNPRAWGWPWRDFDRDTKPILIDSAKLFVADVQECDFRPPAWVTYAFHFASFAADQAASVIDLRRNIDNWWSIIATAIYTKGWTRINTVKEKHGALVQECSRNDLQAAGLTDHIDEDKVDSVPIGLHGRALDHMLFHNKWRRSYPSAFQGYGCHHEMVGELEMDLDDPDEE
jgi:ParB/RepB/Spo0J family partition protein